METLHDIVCKYEPFTNPNSIVDYIHKVKPTWFKSPWERMGAIPLNTSGYPGG